MNEVSFSIPSTRRQLLAGTLAVAGNAVCAQKKYAPRIVCNTFYWVQLFSTPFWYISSIPDPLKAPPPAPPPSTNGLVWTEEQWNTAFSDMQYAGYRRMELVSDTLMGKPIEDVLALLNK